jgi:hypothetical protein
VVSDANVYNNFTFHHIFELKEIFLCRIQRQNGQTTGTSTPVLSGTDGFLSGQAVKHNSPVHSDCHNDR